MSVAAVQDVSGGYNGPHSVVMSNFSSWGPTDDGRIKPDISANGVSLYSADYDADDDYGTKSGTSMATPSVAGSALLLQEHHLNLHGSFMRAATLKGLIIHTADEAGSHSGPDYRFGWGLMNTAKAAQLITDVLISEAKIEEMTLYNGDIHTIHVNATGNEPLIVTLSWTDPPGEADDNVLNNTIPKLVNDLDLSVTDCTNSWQPYILNPANPSAPATTGDNYLDNVEKIVIPNPAEGNYSIHIAHKGTLYAKAPIEEGSQAYSLIISGVQPLEEEGLTVLAEILSDYDGFHVSDIGSCDGIISLDVSGGTPPYTYQWSTSAVGANTSLVDSLCGGDYQVTVTDANGCEAFENVTLEEPLVSYTDNHQQNNQTQIEVFPNPFTDKTTISVTSAISAHVKLTIYNFMGAKTAELYDGFIHANHTYEFVFNSGKRASGVYFYSLTDENGTRQTGKLIITK